MCVLRIIHGRAWFIAAIWGLSNEKLGLVGLRYSPSSTDPQNSAPGAPLVG